MAKNNFEGGDNIPNEDGMMEDDELMQKEKEKR